MRAIPSIEIAHRGDFALLANARGYVDAVEVGTDQGVFALEFLARFEGNWLFCVDPYEPFPDFPYERRGDYDAALQALMPYHGRFRFVLARSVDAAPWVGRVIRPQFVYIDASHRRPDVAEDLDAWWRVLSPGGMLAGHDYDTDHPGVIAAVDEFAAARGLIVRVTTERGSPPSWYLYRDEPAVLIQRFFREGDVANPQASAAP